MRVPARVALLACLGAVVCAGMEVDGEGVAWARADRIAEGRYHLKKANALAGEAKCAAAVKEYTAAYEKLRDPVVLFNRGECYRRMGENARAADDYRAFLKGFPKAPNRAELEARIAALERPAAPARPEPPPARAVNSPPPSPSPSSPSPSPSSPPPRVLTPPPPEPSPSPVTRSAPVASPPPAPEPPAEAPALVTTELPPSPRTGSRPGGDEAGPSGTRWWLWAGLALVATGGGVAGYLLLRPHDAAVPSTALGNYHF